MVKVTINKANQPTDRQQVQPVTPSQQIVKRAALRFDIHDSLGRKITIGLPSALDNLDFTKATGSDRVNIDYQLEVSHLKFVRAIDDEPVATPASEGELRALYSRLDHDGNQAVREGVVEKILSASGDSEEGVKNS